MKRENGLTLIELLVTIAVIAVVIGIGLPNLNRLSESNRSASQVNLISGTLAMARSEAIKRGMNVVVCTSDATINPRTCSGSAAWQNGWLVFADGDNNQTYDSTKDTMLAVNDGLNGGLTMHTLGFTKADQISFAANGSLGANANQGTFVICPGNNALAQSRALNITPVGAINLAPRDASHVPLDLSGTEVTCP